MNKKDIAIEDVLNILADEDVIFAQKGLFHQFLQKLKEGAGYKDAEELEAQIKVDRLKIVQDE